MEYPQITQITQISAYASGRAKRTGRAVGVPQVKGWPSRCREKAALHDPDRTTVPPKDVSVSQVAINPQPKSA